MILTEGDTLIVKELDRLGRSKELLSLKEKVSIKEEWLMNPLFKTPIALIDCLVN